MVAVQGNRTPIAQVLIGGPGSMARHDEMVADDFTPGYPIDLRLPKRRTRMAQGPTGDFEEMAARVVARLTGKRVVIQDDGSKPGMVDIRIDHVVQPPAYVEVVVDIDPAYAQIEASWPVPADRVWHVRVSGRPNLKQLRRELPAIVRDLRDLPGPHVDRTAMIGVLSITGPSEPTSAQPGASTFSRKASADRPLRPGRCSWT